MQKTPVFIMLCGVPGTGKSTWVKNEATLLADEESNTYTVSSDNLLEMIGDEYDMTYNQLFGDVTYMALERMMYKIAKKLFERNNNVIWDQTNLSVKSRARKLAMVPEGYYKVAIIFNEPVDHLHRLSKRAIAQEKVIPEHVLANMKRMFVKPTKAEGFDDVIEVTM